MSQVNCQKLLLNKFTIGIPKKPTPPPPKIPENMKTILGAGGWRELNIFPITTQFNSSMLES